MAYGELGVVLEECGRVLAPEPFMSTVLLGGNAILLGGSDALKKEAKPLLRRLSRARRSGDEEEEDRVIADRRVVVSGHGPHLGDGFLFPAGNGLALEVLDNIDDCSVHAALHFQRTDAGHHGQSSRGQAYRAGH